MNEPHLHYGGNLLCSEFIDLNVNLIWRSFQGNIQTLLTRYPCTMASPRRHKINHLSWLTQGTTKNKRHWPHHTTNPLFHLHRFSPYHTLWTQECVIQIDEYMIIDTIIQVVQSKKTAINFKEIWMICTRWICKLPWYKSK